MARPGPSARSSRPATEPPSTAAPADREPAPKVRLAPIAPAAPPAPLARWQLAVLAVAGDLTWRAVLLLPWVFSLLFGALWWRQAWIWWLLAAVLPLLAWTLWPRTELPGDVLPLSEAPGLQAELRQLLPALEAPPVHALRLDDSFNAAAVQTGLSWWPWGSRRTLVLGLPLLAVLTPAQARAVLAHELGHFSRRHGLLGHWLYRCRAAWMHLAAAEPVDDSPLDRAVQRFARWFGPWFGARALAHARACEFEADAAAAQAADAVQLVSALATLGLAERWLATWAQTGLRQHKLLEPRAPQDWWQRVQAQLLQQGHSPADLNALWSDSEAGLHLARPQGHGDTHPPLAARASALGVQRAQLSLAPPSAEHCAGAAWLKHWPAALAQANATWQARQALQWHAEHLWLALCAQRVRAHEAAAQARLGRLAMRCEVALAMDQLGRKAEAWAWLEALYDQHDRSPALLLALGERVLAAPHTPADQARQALGWLDQAVKADPSLARSARLAAYQWASAHADAAQTARWGALLARAQQRRHQAAGALEASLLAGKLDATVLDEAAQASLQALCAHAAPVQAAWLATAAAHSLDQRAFLGHVLVLQVEPAAMAQAGLDEDSLAQPFAWLLSQLRPSAGDLVLVRVCFASERLLPEQLSRSPASAWRRPAQVDQMSSLSSAPNS